jgi:hypothetical protein
MTRLILASVSVVVGPARFGDDKEAVVTAEKELVVGEHTRATREWRECGDRFKTVACSQRVAEEER